MTGCHNRSNDQVCSPLKTMLGKIGNKYQSYCATYKTHAMTTCHGGTGHTDKNRELDSHIEDTGGIDIGPSDDNESRQFRYYNCFWRIRGRWLPQQPSAQQPGKFNCTHKRNQQLMAMNRSLHTYIQWELQDLSLMLRAQTTSTPTPSEAFEEVIHRFLNTLCTTQKQTNLTNSLLQDIAIFNDTIQQNWRNG